MGTPKTASGFTLTELIVVLVIAGILSAFAAARFYDSNAAATTALSSQFRSLIRYGQKVAIAQQRPVYVNITPGTTSAKISLNFDTASGTSVPAPANSNSGSSATITVCGSSTIACEGVSSGITLSASGATTFCFDPQGEPFGSSQSCTTDLTSTFTGTTITVAGAGVSQSVTIERSTGYVH